MDQQHIQIENQFKHPLLIELEIDVANAKPKNVLMYMKKWVNRKLNAHYDHSQEEDQQQNQYSNKQQTSQKVRNGYQKSSKKYKKQQQFKHRRAVFMAQLDPEQTQQALLKRSVVKNQQAKSRIMINLRNNLFLKNMSWQNINKLVQISDVREYQLSQMIIKKKQTIHNLYIIIDGQITKNSEKLSKKYYQGDSIFVQSIVNITQSAHNYEVTSQKCLICTINSFQIYNFIQSINKKRQQFLEKTIMNIKIFQVLRQQQIFQLICMVKQITTANDQVLITNGQSVSRIYIVMEGEIEKCRVGLDNTIKSFHNYRAGQFFGEDWLSQKNAKAEYMVVSKMPAVIGYIQKSDIQAGIEKISRLVQRKKKNRVKIN